MTVDHPELTGLTAAGKPMSSPLRDVRALSRRMVGHFLDHVIPCATLPGDAVRGDVTAVTRVCLELAVGTLDGQDIPGKIDRLHAAAAGWAREGIPIDTIHHALHAGFRMGFGLVVANLTTEDFDKVVAGVTMMVDILDTMTSTVSRAYLSEYRAVVSEHHNAVHTLVSALLGGHPSSTMARECGITIAEGYAVLALSIPAHPDEHNPYLDGQVVARRKLRRVQAVLASRCRGQALSLLSIDGGTILIPDTFDHDAGLDDLVTTVSEAAQVGVTAALVDATTAQIPDAADQAHEMLDMLARLRALPGLYRFDELALEYQLTRPGPGREVLGALLAPLDEHPELLETLQRHISHDLNRQRTARTLHIHANTVDYRLKRVGQLTGLDPAQPADLWYLRSALIARTYRPQ
ncbi:PucR family transcriptional regulator [Nocardia sp. NPDC059240]|uniref:PucR family transcriptional regulator n=1 Tax=Nocardia sp. NPDC059240 TaxID=3346786 RepID=UPI0036B40953